MDAFHRHTLLALCAIVLCIIALGGCFTVPTTEDIPADLDRATIFQYAQNAVEEGNWEAALIYYQTYADRFPDDIIYFIIARYEIGFIHYRQENYDAARSELEEVLSYYEIDENGEIAIEREKAVQLPLWPQVLTRKVLASIDEANDEATSES